MLKEKFDGAHEVKQKRRSGRRMLVPKYHRFKHHGDIDLVYLVTSPDYCELDVKKGSLGTKGRECNPVSFPMTPFYTLFSSYVLLQKSKGIDGCDLLCCNRGYTTRRERRTERCKCKFHWCCYVECEECVRDVQISTCNWNTHQPWSGTHEHPSSGSRIFIQREKPCLFPIVSITLYSRNKPRPGGLKTWDGRQPQPAEPLDPNLERRPILTLDWQHEELFPCSWTGTSPAP